MIYLYVKTHNQTGLRYLGQTTSKDPYKYPGSGKYWKLHLKKHGSNFSTEILKECSSVKEVKYWGEYYSNLWNIVKDPTWANLKPESGDGGWPKDTRVGKKHTAESKQKMSAARKGVPNPKSSIPRTAEQKEHLRIINSGKTIPEYVRQKMSATRRKNPLKHSEESKEKMRGPKTQATRLKMKEAQNVRRNSIKVMWITDGNCNQLVNINTKIPIGWNAGRTTEAVPPSQKGKFWINNGIKNKMSVTVLSGWQKGRLYKRKAK